MIRTLYICYKNITKEEYKNISINSNNNLDKIDLILLTFAGIRDTIRKCVYEAGLKCKETSINALMITDDNIQTSHSIKTEYNILDNNILIIDKKNKEEKLLGIYFMIS